MSFYLFSNVPIYFSRALTNYQLNTISNRVFLFLKTINYQEKTTYGRLRVLTAPPTSVHEMATGGAAAGTTGSETTSPRDFDGLPFLFDAKGGDGTTHGSRRNLGSGSSGSGVGGATAGTSGVGSNRRTNLRTSSGCGSTQRLSGGNRDHSVTQFALIDDENVSALQQVRHKETQIIGLFFVYNR